MHSFSYVELIDKLKQRFGSGNLTAQFKSQLKARRRGKSESLQTLYTDICRLLSLAYPNQFELPTTQEIGIDCFLEAIDDPQLERRVRDKDFASLDETFRHCLKLEAFDKAISMRTESRPVHKHAARTVKIDTQNEEIAKLLNQLFEKQAELEKDNRELRTRLLKLENKRSSEPQRSRDNGGVDSVANGEAEPIRYSSRRICRRCIKCYNCNRFGHISRNCRAPRRNRDNEKVFSEVSNASRGDECVGRARSVLSINQNTSTEVTNDQDLGRF